MQRCLRALTCVNTALEVWTPMLCSKRGTLNKGDLARRREQMAARAWSVELGSAAAASARLIKQRNQHHAGDSELLSLGH